eukprot:196172_1
MSDVVCKQVKTWGNGPCNPMCCIPKLTVIWNRATINDILKDRGLTQNIVNQEIDLLNKNASQFFQYDIYGYFWWFIIILTLIASFVGGIIGVINNTHAWWAVPLLIALAGCCSVIPCVCIQARHQTRWNEFLLYIGTYMREELNPRYQTLQISWRMRPRWNGIRIRRSGGRYGSLNKYSSIDNCVIDISIYPIDCVHVNADNERNSENEGNDTKIDVNMAMDSEEGINEILIEKMCVEDGYYRFGCFGTDKVIEVSDNSKRIGGVLQIFDKTERDNQWFYVERVDGDYYMIRCKHSGLYWNFIGSSKDNNRNVTQWNYHGLDNQQFKFVETDNGHGDFNIIAKHSDKALCVEYGVNENGAKIIQFDVNDDCQQLFHFS